MSWKQAFYNKGFSCVERTLETWDKPLLFWYKIDVGDKRMGDKPIIEDCFATDFDGNNLSGFIDDNEWKELENSV